MLNLGFRANVATSQLLQQQLQCFNSSSNPRQLVQVAAARHHLASRHCSSAAKTPFQPATAVGHNTLYKHLLPAPAPAASQRHCVAYSTGSSSSSAMEPNTGSSAHQPTSPPAPTASTATPQTAATASSSGNPQQTSSNPASNVPQATTATTANPSSSSSSSSRSSVIKQTISSSGMVVNKEPISSSMSPQLYSYLLSHTRELEILAELRKETATMHGGHMQISPEQGQLLSLLVELLGVKSAIEVGVFTGYSSLAVALALPANGKLVAFDRDEKTMSVAQRYWDMAGVSDKIEGRLGPALEGLQELLKENGENSFDMAFIDADKRGYRAYFDLCLQLVRPGGLIAVDNVLFYGKVADPEAKDKATLALKQFNDDLMRDDRVSFSIVPIGDGMALCKKR